MTSRERHDPVGDPIHVVIADDGHRHVLVEFLKSFTDYLRDPAGVATDPSFANFSEAWELANFPQYMANSAIYTATATIIFILTSLDANPI